MAPCLLRAHVGWCPDHRALERRRDAEGRLRRVTTGRRERLGDAEVEQLDRAVRAQHDVGRLEIAMHESLGVRRLQSLRYLTRHSACLGHTERTCHNTVS